ncbi:hypothetical protein A4X06_0g7541 [Tilletia controversa]|uniref:Uncharacterized protein n=1 Tax=Tilletia controversa TaxID=13291 RepID=A0A8X7SU19_9BASI|nr:hypothetical protein CF328_g6869 [Tilletia controversa]KAE8241429.1 hypothetical protein A4X06_0g7541 [Tilletia controversa]CAD6976781.1 unnamed protein product [Tilletia controversa]
MLRVVLSVGQFRPLRDFDQPDSARNDRYHSRSAGGGGGAGAGAGLARDEFKLYLWRNSTLRDVVRLVHASAHLAKHPVTRDPAACSAQALHEIRLVYYDPRTRSCIAREMGRDIARVSVAEYTSALLGIGVGAGVGAGASGATAAAAAAAATTTTTELESQLLVEEKRALERLKTRDRASDTTRTLRKCQLRDGDVLECVVFPDKAFVGAAAPAAAAAAAATAPPRAGLGPGTSFGRDGPPMHNSRGGGHNASGSRMGFSSSRGGRWN